MKLQYLILSKQEPFICSSIHYLSNFWVTAVERPFPVTASSSAWQVIFKSLLAKWSVIQKSWLLFRASSSLTFFPNVLKYKNGSAKHLMTGSPSGSHQQLTSRLMFVPPRTPRYLSYPKIHMYFDVHNLEGQDLSKSLLKDRTNLQQVFPKETLITLGTIITLKYRYTVIIFVLLFIPLDITLF